MPQPNRFSSIMNSDRSLQLLSDKNVRAFLKPYLTIDLLLDEKPSEEVLEFIMNDEELLLALIANVDYDNFHIVDVVESGLFRNVAQKNEVIHIFFKRIYPTIGEKALLHFLGKIAHYSSFACYEEFFEKNQFYQKAIDIKRLQYSKMESIKKNASFFLEKYPIFRSKRDKELIDQVLLLKLLIHSENILIRLIKTTENLPELFERIIFYFNEPFYERYMLTEQNKPELVQELDCLKPNFLGLNRWINETTIPLSEFAAAISSPADPTIIESIFSDTCLMQKEYSADMSLFCEKDFCSEDYSLLLEKNIDLALHLFKLYLIYLQKASKVFLISEGLASKILFIISNYSNIDWDQEHKQLQYLIIYGFNRQNFLKLTQFSTITFSKISRKLVENILSKFYTNERLEIEAIVSTTNLSLLEQLISYSEELAFDLIQYKPQLMTLVRLNLSFRSQNVPLNERYHREIYISLGEVFFRKFYPENAQLSKRILVKDIKTCDLLGQIVVDILKNKEIKLARLKKLFPSSMFGVCFPSRLSPIKPSSLFNMTGFFNHSNKKEEPLLFCSNIEDSSHVYCPDPKMNSFISKYFIFHIFSYPYKGHPYLNIQKEILKSFLRETIEHIIKKHKLPPRSLLKNIDLVNIIDLLNSINEELEFFYLQSALPSSYSRP